MFSASHTVLDELNPIFVMTTNLPSRTCPVSMGRKSSRNSDGSLASSMGLSIMGSNQAGLPGMAEKRRLQGLMRVGLAALRGILGHRRRPMGLPPLKIDRSILQCRFVIEHWQREKFAMGTGDFTIYLRPCDPTALRLSKSKIGKIKGETGDKVMGLCSSFFRNSSLKCTSRSIVDVYS